MHQSERQIDYFSKFARMQMLYYKVYNFTFKSKTDKFVFKRQYFLSPIRSHFTFYFNIFENKIKVCNLQIIAY